MGERSVFRRTLYKFVISTEGVAVVEKPAGKTSLARDLTVKHTEPYFCYICGRIQAGSSTSLRSAQNDRFLLVHAVEVPLI